MTDMITSRVRYRLNLTKNYILIFDIFEAVGGISIKLTWFIIIVVRFHVVVFKKLSVDCVPACWCWLGGHGLLLYAAPTQAGT